MSGLPSFKNVDVQLRDGLTIHAEVSGTGEPVVVLHGFTGDASTMRSLSERLCLHHEVIVAELVGHGRSSIPADIEIYGVEQMASQILQVGQILGHEAFHLVGYSMGGRVALTLACNSPETVKSLSLIGATAGIADDADRAQRRRDDDLLADRLESDPLGDFVDDWMAKPLFETQRRLGATHLENARRQRLANDPAGLARSLRGGGTGAMPPLHSRLAGCTVAAVLIAGSDDHKFTTIATDLAESLPNGRAETIPNAGHAAHLEQPDAVVAVIEKQIAAAR